MLRHASADTIRGYHIGNSLTWSAVSPGLPSVFQGAGASLSLGHHIRCGSPLADIVSDPTVVCVPAPAPYGNWQNALAQYEWDYVTIQTHAGMTADEIQAAIDVVAIATAEGRNSGTRFFIYSAWPTRSDTATYRDIRTQPLTITALNSNAVMNELYLDLVAAYPAVDFGYIPGRLRDDG